MQPNPIFVPMTVSVDSVEIGMQVNVESPSLPMELGTAINVKIVDAPVYEGEYVVTPKAEAQTLETAERMMEDNVVVLEIPYAEVSNLSGGYTVIIGGD